MERDIEKIDESHSRQKFTMQGESELSQWMRTFPDPMPSTHELHYFWGVNARNQPVLSIEPRPKAEPTAAADAAAKASETPATPALDTSTVEELKTRAAELGVAVNPKWNKAQLTAAVKDAAAKK